MKFRDAVDSLSAWVLKEPRVAAELIFGLLALCAAVGMFNLFLLATN
jgi:hypothetical protein